jgi:NADPH-dependent 2,4-dienoyl-CoA reductase/sulfur reductase-like enzyme
VRTGAGVTAIEGANRVESVVLSDGSRLPAEVVVLGLGTVPETTWLTGSGLDLRDGVVCDERLAAVGAEGVYAVGDVARWYHPRYQEHVRVEHWTNAVETAAVVGSNLTGHATAHKPVPYVWSDQLGGRVQVFGRVRPEDELRVVQGDLDDRFVALTGGAGVLQSVVGFRMVPATLKYSQMLEAGAAWHEDVLMPPPVA